MKRSLVLVIVMILVLGLVFSACDAKTPPPTTPTTGGDTQPVEETRALNVGSVYASKSFDPWAPTSAYDNSGRANIYDTLLCKDGEGKIVGSLAETWEWSDDTMQVVFHLVDGVTFHNGAPMTAEDVKFSLDTAKDADVCKAYMSAIESVEIVDDSTIQVNLNRPNMALLEVLITWGQIVNQEVYAGAGEQAGATLESVVGTGPYKLTAWVPSESATYEANESYFKGAPTIKNISVKSITDPTAAVIALETGDIDVYTASVPAISLTELEGYNNVEVLNVPAQRLYYLGMNWENGPFVNNQKLREAVAYAIDRDALNLITNEGHGEIVYYPGKSTYSGYPTVANAGYKYDPEKAKELVKEAGAEGLAFSISLENSGSLPQLATAIQSMLGEVGLDVTVNSMDTNAYMADVYANGNYDMFISFTTAKTKDIDTVWTNLFSTANIGQGNSGRYSNAEMDKVLEDGRAEANENARRNIYKTGVELFERDIPYLALFYEYGNRVVSSELSVENGMAEYDCFYYYAWK